VVAAPRVVDPAWAARLRRLRGRGWAAVPIGSIVGVIFLIRYAPNSANAITYVALVSVPILAAVALGWAMRGARPPFGIIAVGLFVVTWRSPTTLAGEAAGAILDALSCVTLGVLLSTVTPPAWLKAGIVAMACADVWLVSSDLLQAPNATLSAAAPSGGLPQLQSEQFGTVTLGYGDLFVAALLGAVYSGARRTQWLATGLTLAFAIVFDFLFFVVDELPATVPVALALVALQLWHRRRRRRDSPVSAPRGPSRPAAGTPRRGT
jgi:hypothetical protein